MDVTFSEWLRAQLADPAPEAGYRRLTLLLKEAILSGRLADGTKLPSSRTFSVDLGLARNTVTRVYEQLQVEGYVETQAGSGTYVACTSAAQALGARPPAGPRRRQRLSWRGERAIEMADAAMLQWGAFMPGLPDVTQFPRKTWSRLSSRVWRDQRPELMIYAPPGGYRPLRRALADYLRVARAANCRPEQIIVTTGTHQSLDLAIRMLCDEGDEVWVEDPCYWGMRSLPQASGLKLVPVPVDGEGLNPGPRHLARPPRLIICTPSHQFPMGCVMSLSRRRMLLEYARRHGCWIVEDDYDSEFRYGVGPVASLQGLDAHGQVIYVGSFSKLLFPGMRVGYMVAPDALADPLAQGLATLYREGQMMQQATLTEFINDGHLASHIRCMRSLYTERHDALLQAITARYGERFPVLGREAGLHLTLALPAPTDDRAVVRRARELGVLARPLSSCYGAPAEARPGLVLGYANVPVERIGPAFERLAQAVDQSSR